MKLPGSMWDMASKIMRVAGHVPSLWHPDVLWADVVRDDEHLRPFIEETKDELRKRVHLKSSREARQWADFIWSARENRRGRNQEINLDLLKAVLECVECIAGKPLSYSRKRRRWAPLETATTGPPEGALFDVLLAALDWAYSLPTPQRRSAPLNAEGVLSAIKRLRHPQDRIKTRPP
jgi:hypothetical protein